MSRISRNLIVNSTEARDLYLSAGDFTILLSLSFLNYRDCVHSIFGKMTRQFARFGKETSGLGGVKAFLVVVEQSNEPGGLGDVREGEGEREQ